MNYEEALTKWRSEPVNNVNDLDTKLENFRILFAYNSNKIENEHTTYHDTREVFENGKVVGYSGDVRTLFELQNQRSCYEFLKERIAAKKEIDLQLIKDVHEQLMHGCYDERRWQKGERPGTFKVHDHETGDGVGSAPEEVEKDLLSLLAELKDVPADRITTAASYFHLRFESVHPFADGNGRVGRTLLNYYLMINDYPPAIIYEEDKKSYYMALALYDTTEDISGFESFLKEETCKTWTKKPKAQKTLAMLL